MTRFYEEIAEILESTCVSADTRLGDHGWDSLAVISTVALIDELFGQVVPGAALAACETVGDVERLIVQPVPA